MKNLNTDYHTFLISFSWKTTNCKFIFQDGQSLMQLIKENDTNGIEYIKIFDCKNAKFKRIAKKELLNFFSLETEAILFLKEYYFFK